MSKKILALLMTLGLVGGALAAPAVAKKKKTRKPVAVATALFMDGEGTYGEQEQANQPPAKTGTYLKLTPAAGTAEKSISIPSYGVGPNNNCAGNSLFPVFTGAVTGTVTGDVKVTFEAQATPSAKAEVRIWPDIAAQTCNADYIEPAGKVVVDLPSSKGPVTATIPGVNFAATQQVMIQVTGVAGSVGPPPSPTAPFYARMYYGTDAAKVEFSCVPTVGSASCLRP
jgi:hypothetical protein